MALLQTFDGLSARADELERTRGCGHIQSYALERLHSCNGDGRPSLRPAADQRYGTEGAGLGFVRIRKGGRGKAEVNVSSGRV